MKSGKMILALPLVFMVALANANDDIVLVAEPAQTYVCQDGKSVTAQYFNNTEKTISLVKLTMATEARFLPSIVSGSGSRYTDERDIEWWLKGDEASLNYDLHSDDASKTTLCSIKP
ncbi:MliC family protein [Thiothrix nivea]|uniref:C-type lysozyme inhibitor domain-containing protein n=1 Tax=Thiothrix nivea (strain ATCC 35100 / DSM 5205 / JP2) TaxID=870187 RepID=A0A656HJC4_THINJ|nr:MliC family protein [Thiothrix nivea]EIJ36302.1 Protein of unknown function DUF2091, periplasmic [Thiothrix nivea DSM 5205]